MDARIRCGPLAVAARSSIVRLLLENHWDEIRSQNCAAVTPCTRTTFSRLRSPLAMVTEERGTFKDLEKYSTQASLAAPSTGGAVSASFSAPPISPVMEFFLARGCTFTAKLMPPEPSVTATMGLPPGSGNFTPAFAHVKPSAVRRRLLCLLARKLSLLR